MVCWLMVCWQARAEELEAAIGQLREQLVSEQKQHEMVVSSHEEAMANAMAGSAAAAM